MGVPDPPDVCVVCNVAWAKPGAATTTTAAVRAIKT
jgi:hypothetical protein